MQKAIRILQLRIFEDEGEGSTFLQEVSPASPSPSPDKERARKMTVTSGLICLGPYVKSGPIGSLVRMLLASSRWYNPARRLTWVTDILYSERWSLYIENGKNMSLRPFAEILNRKDIPSNRYLYRLVPSVHRTAETAFGLLPTPMARDFSPRGPNCRQKGLPEIIRERLLPTPLATEIHHRERVEQWKREGRLSMHDAEDGEKNPNGLIDFLDFHGLLPTPTARDWKGASTLENLQKKGKKPHQGSLPDFFAQTGKSFQLNPLFVAEMMGFPPDWTVLPFLPGDSNP